MIKSKDDMPAEISIDLTGPEGNAYCLMGYAKRWSKEIGLDPVEVQKELVAGDYDNLVNVMEKHFGGYVTFYK